MTLVKTETILANAREAGEGVGAFNVIHLETAEALVSAAEESRRPVILQLSENCVRYHGSFEPIARAMLTIAEESAAPVAVHLDHAEDPQLAMRAIDIGFGSVMYDGSVLDFAENVDTTRRVVAHARTKGTLVEAELGKIGGKDGAHAPGVQTDPDEAARFVAKTGVGALAVAVGSSHAMTQRTTSLDLDLVARLADAVPVPLVLHGSSGVSDAMMVAGVQAGLTKINVSTHLNAAFTAAVREYLTRHPDVVDSRKYIASGREALQREAARLLRLFAATGLGSEGGGDLSS